MKKLHIEFVIRSTASNALDVQGVTPVLINYIIMKRALFFHQSVTQRVSVLLGIGIQANFPPFFLLEKCYIFLLQNRGIWVRKKLSVSLVGTVGSYYKEESFFSFSRNS